MSGDYGMNKIIFYLILLPGVCGQFVSGADDRNFNYFSKGDNRDYSGYGNTEYESENENYFTSDTKLLDKYGFLTIMAHNFRGDGINLSEATVFEGKVRHMGEGKIEIAVNIATTGPDGKRIFLMYYFSGTPELKDFKIKFRKKDLPNMIKVDKITILINKAEEGRAYEIRCVDWQIKWDRQPVPAWGEPIQDPEEVMASVTSERDKQNRKLWLELIEGENLALKKKAAFAPLPSDRLTTDEKDEKDLTDGMILTSRRDDRIWMYVKDTVGWAAQTTPVNIMIDLGSVQPIERVVIRLLGGKEQGSLSFPSKVELLCSENGIQYHSVRTIQKALEGDQASEDQEGVISIREEGSAFVYPLAFKNLGLRARFIGMTIHPEHTWLFTDEIAVIKAKETDVKGTLSSFAQKPFFLQGVVFAPLKDIFTVSGTILAPNFFSMNDMRDAAAKKNNPVRFCIELPEGFEVIETKRSGTVSSEKIASGTRWIFQKMSVVRTIQAGPVFIRVKDPAKTAGKAAFYAEDGLSKVNRTELPVRVIKIPDVPKLKRFSISLGWMTEDRFLDWPDVFKNTARLGFNTTQFFPHQWKDKVKEEWYTSLLKQSRDEGLKIIYMDSPVHQMEKVRKSEPEIYSQLPDGKISTHICPSYRGKFYLEEMERITRDASLVRPDIAIWDIELHHYGAQEANNCATCLAYMKAKGLEGDPFLHSLGYELLRDLRAAVKKASEKEKFPMPVIGMYNVHSGSFDYHRIFNISNNYRKTLDFLNPSLYVKGDAVIVHERCRADYQMAGKRESIPWLSAGTYGEFEPELMEPYLLEALMNGAAGFTYYCYEDFDTPLDLAYQARALTLIAPFENMLFDGKMIFPKYDNQKVKLTCWQHGSELLLLAGNYRGSDPQKVTVTLPWKNVTYLKELSKDEKPPAGQNLILSLKPKQFFLFHIKGN